MMNYSDSDDISPEKIIGKYAPGKGNFGFVDVEWKPKWYFVFWWNSKDALPGDIVEAQLRVFKGREEAIVTRVVERRKALLSGVFQQVKGKDFGFVVPQNKDFQEDIFIPARKTKGAQTGDMVAIEIVGWNGKNPEGKVMKKLGKLDERWVDILAIAVENGARLWWSDTVQRQVAALQAPTDSEIESRKDLRKQLTVTIDGPDSKDLDDAISVQLISPKNPPQPPLTKGGGNTSYKLSVHIADVTNYVPENSAIDMEAQTRWTSIYLVDKVIPMLPEALSNGLCSLNPHETKLSLTCEIEINSAGHIKASRVYESVIESDYRLTYQEVDEILDTTLQLWDMLEFGGIISQELIDMLQTAQDLQHILTRYKRELWVLEFDFPEPKIKLDEQGNPIEYTQYPKYSSNKMIEEFMVSANEAVSKQFSHGPFVYRSHEAPDEEDLEKLYKIVSNFGYTLDNIRDISSKDISGLLSQIKWTPKEKLLGKIILRSLKKANYSPILVGHFGLGLSYYSHFTSPIRRYPDLQIHRIIKESLTKKLSAERTQYYKQLLPGLCAQNSQSEVTAQSIEYKIWDLMAAKYMQNKIGQKFEGVISGMMQKWFFVELPNTIEWYIRVDSLKGFFEYYEETMEMRWWNTTYQIGDKIQVELINVDMAARQIDFEVVLS